jgi:hypothetical protein
MTTGIGTLIGRCMGLHRFQMQCKNCDRLPRSVNEEDDCRRWIHPELDAKNKTRDACMQFIQRHGHL